MKKLIKNISYIALIAVVFASCKKEISQVSYVDGTAPVLSASSTNSLVLNMADKAITSVTFNWTNPNYKFTTGLSSQDVNYTLQIDTSGANFKSPNLKEMVIAKDLSTTLTVGALNGLLANWQENIPHNFEFRIKSTVGVANSLPLYSNVVKITITPYLDVNVAIPFTGNLYLIGSATPGGDATGWNNPVPVPSQQFTKTSSTTWEITIPLIGGKEFLIIPDNGSWSNKYAVKKSDVTPDGGPFGYNFGDNFPGPASSGTYKIVLNFKTGNYTVTKQ
ncbi:MAG: SusE domain-containing protein [Bacteroidetes bacterium]|nr:SusE domain-containing protein [Bacteroidota bacterium]